MALTSALHTSKETCTNALKRLPSDHSTYSFPIAGTSPSAPRECLHYSVYFAVYSVTWSS